MTHLRIRELAEKRGLNITTLARKAELSYSTAHALWHDKVSQFDRRTLIRVALALDVRVDELFGGDPDVSELGPIALAAA
jgi:transcriptional regulator with XRE-family HTH domain